MSEFTCKGCHTERPRTLYNKKFDVCNLCVPSLKYTEQKLALEEAAGEAGVEVQRPAAPVEPVDLDESESRIEIASPDDLRRELAKRELSRRKLLAFVHRFNPAYKAGWVHRDICTKLEEFSAAVMRGEAPRLMLFMPPRHGKSELASRNFPAFHLGQAPQHEFIACSYSGSLAMKFSRKVRSLVLDPNYQKLFPETVLNSDSQAVEAWLTSAGGGYMAAGVNGPITGNGFNIGVIDDPVKNREDAESENARETVRDWYTSTFYTRRAPGAGILIILTRWHHDDLAGWLLNQQETGAGDKWDVVVYPAIAEQDERYRKKGEALHPERYPISDLEQARRVMGPRDFQALYQQQPSGDEGDYFKKRDFVYYKPEELPARELLSVYLVGDLAIGQKQSNDYTVFVIVGIDSEGHIWVLDMVRGRFDALEICEELLALHLKWRPNRVGIERGQILMTIWPLLQKIMRERNIWDLQFDPENDGLNPGKSDKPARARGLQGRMRQKMVHFPVDAEWMPALVTEMLQFPNGVHDDQVDAMAWVGLMLTMFVEVFIRTEKKKSWKDKLDKFVYGSKGAHSAMGA